MERQASRLIIILIVAVCVACTPAIPYPVVSPLSPLATPRITGKLVPRAYLPIVSENLDPELEARPVSAKKGIAPACGYSDMERFENELRSMRISWLWNWNPNPPIFAGIESIPSIWGINEMDRPVGGNSKWLMGFNEPDLSGQSALSPSKAADLWHKIEQRYPDKLLASPQPSHVAGNWLEDWQMAYIAIYERAPRIDAIAFHCYLDLNACIALTEHYAQLARDWGVPEIWVSEFSFWVNPDEPMSKQLDNLRRYVEYLENHSMVTRYAYYSNRGECCYSASTCSYNPALDPYLFHWTGQMSLFGKLYRRLP